MVVACAGVDPSRVDDAAEGGETLNILKLVHKKTQEMLEEQEAVRDRLFTVRDVMQSNVREKLQERSVRVTHNLSVIGGGGLLLSIIDGLFIINVDGIPGSSDEPHAFAKIFSFCLFLLGASTIAIGMHPLGLKPAPPEEGVSSWKVELQEGGRGARESPLCFLRQFTAELRSQLPTQSRRS